jgi:hypothetical protein
MQPPGRVKGVPRLRAYLEVMILLVAAEDPPLRRVRAKSKINIMYCYGDASGSGLVGALILETVCGMSWENGVRVCKR